MKKISYTIFIIILISIIIFLIGENKRIELKDEYENSQKNKISLYELNQEDIASYNLSNLDTNIFIEVKDNEEKIVPNAEFEMYNENYEIIARKSSNYKGILAFSGMKSGTYYIKQVNSVDGFDIDSSIYKINVDDEAKYFELSIVNVRNEGYDENKQYKTRFSIKEEFENREEILKEKTKLEIKNANIKEVKKCENDKWTNVAKEQDDENNKTYYIYLPHPNLKNLSLKLHANNDSEDINGIRNIIDNKEEGFDDYNVDKLSLDISEGKVVRYMVNTVSNIDYNLKILNSNGEKVDDQDEITGDSPVYLKHEELYNNNVYLHFTVVIEYENKRYKIEFLEAYDVLEEVK